MRVLQSILYALLALAIWGSGSNLTASPRLTTQHAATLVCVEQVWCNIAQQIGGPALTSTALITAEGLDPHHISPTPEMARKLASSDAVLLNGATYDDWALPLISPHAQIFRAATSENWHEGDDAHLFFDLPTVKNTAHDIAQWLSHIIPSAQPDIAQRLLLFDKNITALTIQLNAIHKLSPEAPFAMTEPAGERLLLAAGLKPTNMSWARAIMNETGLSPRETAQLEQTIQQHRIKFLVKNPTVTAPQAENIEIMAHQAHIPVVTIGESLPSGVLWQEWIHQLLGQVQQAITQAASHP